MLRFFFQVLDLLNLFLFNWFGEFERRIIRDRIILRIATWRSRRFEILFDCLFLIQLIYRSVFITLFSLSWKWLLTRFVHQILWVLTQENPQLFRISNVLQNWVGVRQWFDSVLLAIVHYRVMQVYSILLKRQIMSFHRNSLLGIRFLHLLLFQASSLQICLCFGSKLQLRFWIFKDLALLRPVNHIFIQNIEYHGLVNFDKHWLPPEIFVRVNDHFILVVHLYEFWIYLGNWQQWPLLFLFTLIMITFTITILLRLVLFVT